MDEREWLTQEHDPELPAGALSDDESDDESAAEAPSATRRGFLYRATTALLGLVVAIGPALTGIYVFLDPLRRRKNGPGEFIEVTTVAAVPPDGKPRLFRVIADKRDAWTTFPEQPIGAVYLRRLTDAPDEVIAFNTTCPHAGCFVNLRAEGYYCPCHNSTFQLDGSRGDPCVAARGMDSLEAKVVDGKILVRFQNFLTGREEKVATT